MVILSSDGLSHWSLYSFNSEQYLPVLVLFILALLMICSFVYGLFVLSVNLVELQVLKYWFNWFAQVPWLTPFVISVVLELRNIAKRRWWRNHVFIMLIQVDALGGGLFKGISCSSTDEILQHFSFCYISYVFMLSECLFNFVEILLNIWQVIGWLQWICSWVWVTVHIGLCPWNGMQNP